MIASLAPPLALLALVVVASATTISSARSTAKRSVVVEGRESAIAFLRNYGYLDVDIRNSAVSESTLRHAVSLFQEFYDLSIDGQLNAETMRAMSKPRCGVRDIESRQRDSHRMPKWPKRHLTWNFLLASQENLKVAEAAFALWAANSSLTFSRSTHNPNILISYNSGRHTMWAKDYSNAVCPNDLDGPGGVLAHAYYPNGDADYVSEVHLDNEETWHVQLNENPWNAELLLHTLTHEIGHALGITHSPRNDSIMYAFVPFQQWPVKLSLDDVLAVQNLYGPKPDAPDMPPVSTFVPPTIAPPATTTTTTTTTTTMPPPPRKPEPPKQPTPPRTACELRDPDVVLLTNNIMFLTQGIYAFPAETNWGPRIYPRRLDEYLRFLPSGFKRIDAAYQRPSGELVLFVGGKVYMASYPGLQLLEGWPRSLNSVGLPSNAVINAAFNTPMGHTYIIFNNDTVALVDECHLMIKEYSKLYIKFPGIPTGISLAFRYSDGNLYFVYSNRFISFNEFDGYVMAVGNFNMGKIGIHCPDKEILFNLKSLVARLDKYGSALFSE